MSKNSRLEYEDVLEIALSFCKSIFNDAHIRATQQPARGTDGGSIILAEGQENSYAVKFAKNPRRHFNQHRDNAETLRSYLGTHIPKIYKVETVSEWQFMVYENKGNRSVHQMVKDGHESIEQLSSIWKSFIDSLADMYANSKSVPFQIGKCPRNHYNRIGQINDYIRNVFLRGNREYFERFEIIINGRVYPSTASLFPRLSVISEPEFAVTCHGDPHPANLIVDNDLSWSMVDFEWSGAGHDYRWMASHLWGWWPIKYSRLVTDPVLKFGANQIIIDFDYHFSGPFEKLQGFTKNLLLVTSEQPDEDLVAINLFLAALYLREMKFIHNEERAKFQPLLFAQAIQLLSDPVSGEASPFRFNL